MVIWVNFGSIRNSDGTLDRPSAPDRQKTQILRTGSGYKGREYGQSRMVPGRTCLPEAEKQGSFAPSAENGNHIGVSTRGGLLAEY
jgi:hypothetical protein